VEAGPKPLVGRAVFCLHPHQDIFQVPVEKVAPLPEDVPPRRATLSANMETALNALWDAAVAPADRIVIVGAGIVGLLIAYLAARLPGADVTVIDPVEGRRALVEAFGAKFSSPPAGEAARRAGGGERRKAGPTQAAAPHPDPLPAEERGEGMSADVVFH